MIPKYWEEPTLLDDYIEIWERGDDSQESLAD
jgi:hypothetical protein